MVAHSGLAPAKVNLFLHVGPADGAGYHPLASLAAFADIGDRVSVQRAERLSLSVDGPFAAGLAGPGDNLVLRALRALGEAARIGEPAVAVSLDKQLPIAAGLGGGSSDAGTALKLVRDLLALDFDDEALARIAAQVGSDGPMCLYARAAWAEGRGEVLTPELSLPPLPALLVNPGVPSPTGEVYRAYDAGPARSAERPAPPVDWSVAGVTNWLAGLRNDLEAPAMDRTPLISTTLRAVDALPEVRLARMSGSGATVFALFDTLSAARLAARKLTVDHPDWWIRATILS